MCQPKIGHLMLWRVNRKIHCRSLKMWIRHGNEVKFSAFPARFSIDLYFFFDLSQSINLVNLIQNAYYSSIIEILFIEMLINIPNLDQPVATK
jgi:dihydroneopterin aldolase